MKLNRPLILCTGLLAFLPMAALAQDSPKYEVFAGYSFMDEHINGYGPSNGLNGWESSLTGYVNKWAGIEADFSGFYGTAGENGAYKPSFTFMAGPHFAFRNRSRVTPFIHLLAGGVHGSSTLINLSLSPCVVGQPCLSTITQSQTAFAAAGGFGIDVKVSRSISIRAIQADYLFADFSGHPLNPPLPALYFSPGQEHSVRLSAGIVFSFGGR